MLYTHTSAHYTHIHVHYYVIMYAELLCYNPVKRSFFVLLVAKNSPISVPTQCSCDLLNENYSSCSNLGV